MSASVLPWPTFPEQIVLQDVIEHSAVFRRYYHSERDHIDGDIHWAQDSTLPEGIDYRRTLIPIAMSGAATQVIRLRRIPAACSDAVGIAHELQHLILDQEGFPTVYAPAQFETLSAALTSMIHDPIVNERLRAYGFDLQHTYEQEARESIRQLRSMPHAPAHPVNKLHWIVNYTGKLLDREVLGPAADGTADAFQTWFEGRYPAIAHEAHDLRALIRTIGYALPTQQAHLFKAIIQRYRLEEIILVAPRSFGTQERTSSHH